MAGIQNSMTALNALCPYFTMYPIEFPYRVLKRHKTSGAVLDPFCGRGTTNAAARSLNLPSVGIDTHPVAVAASRAKLSGACHKETAALLRDALATPTVDNPPEGEFWSMLYHEDTLDEIMRVRAYLCAASADPAAHMLTAAILGVLHGPLRKTAPSYLSNQMPRTYATKPRYQVKFWNDRDLADPPMVSLEEVVLKKLNRSDCPCHVKVPPGSAVVEGDSRDPLTYASIGTEFDWVVTSPPYYGLKTYGPDQWLRLWFLGGPSEVDYHPCEQLTHRTHDEFAHDLRSVWANCADVCSKGAKMVIRFGSIPSRKSDPFEILKNSLSDTRWYIQTKTPSGAIPSRHRQAAQFGASSDPAAEFDLWATLR